MDKVDLLFKIKRLEKENIALQLEIKQLKKQIKQQELFIAKLYTEAEMLSQEVSKWKPFEDGETIIESKLNKK